MSDKPDFEGWRESSYRFQPKDPDIARDTIARCREVLQRYDWRLNVWWSAHRACWRIVQFGQVSGNWSTLGNWVKDDGSYRQPSPSEMLAFVQKCDQWAKDTDAEKLSRKLDIQNHERDMKASETKRDETMRFAVEMANEQASHWKGTMRHERPKLTFGGLGK